MAKPSKRKRGRKSPQNLLKNGLAFMAAGAALLTVATILSSGRPVMAALSTAMSMPAWWAVGIGLVLVVIHLVIRLANRPPPRSPALLTSPRKAPSAIRALIDQAEMDLLDEVARKPAGAAVAPESPEPR